MEDKHYNLTKEESNETINSWINRDYIGEELREKLEQATALIVPNENPHTGMSHTPYFPEGTEHLVSFLENSNTENQNIDICIEENDYKELALHADLLTIANVIVTMFGAPIIVKLVADYISKRVGSRKDDTTVKSSLTVTDANSGKSINLTYEGPASTYEKVMFGAIEDILPEISESSSEIKKIGSNSEHKNESE